MKRLPKIDLPEGRFLRLLKEHDINQAYIDALNNKERIQHMTSVKGKTTHADVVHYVTENSGKNNVLLFGVFEGDTLLGTSRLHDIDFNNKTANMGIFIFSYNPCRKGLGTSMIEKLADFAFDELGLETVYAGIFLNNEASSRAFSKAGFNVFDSADYYGRPYQKWIKRRTT